MNNKTNATYVIGITLPLNMLHPNFQELYNSRRADPVQCVSMKIWYRQEERQTDHFLRLGLGIHPSRAYMSNKRGELL
jgi:hypothetical protein